LETLLGAGYRLWQQGRKSSESDASTVVLTFDDGYAHLAKVLPTLLSQFEFTPIVFVPTFWIGKTNGWDYSCGLQPLDHADEADLRRLADAGVIIGSHGRSHQPLTLLDPQACLEELAESRRTLERITGASVDCLSYPFGRSNPTVIAAAEKAGYRLGYTMSSPAGSDCPLARGRLPVYAFDSPRAILRRLDPTQKGRWQRLIARTAHRLSAGTVLLNRLRGTL
jgi:peptidoglycan/xylan/chitin deacetylase (PgdA/CDA1 family)